MAAGLEWVVLRPVLAILVVLLPPPLPPLLQDQG